VVETEQAVFSGWAVVELMGHQSEIGFVKTQAFGQAVMFRIDTPELPELEPVIDGEFEPCPDCGMDADGCICSDDDDYDPEPLLVGWEEVDEDALPTEAKTR
jgi:hypothetical protein